MKKKELKKECIICHTVFLISSRLSLKDREKRKSCSLTCGNQAKRVSNFKYCEFCGKEFEARLINGNSVPKKRFCSIDCRKKRPLSEEHKAKIGLSRSGEKCNWWKGGIWNSQPQKDRKTVKYRRLRKEIFIRDDYTCQICKQKGGELNIDHIKPYSKYPDLRYEKTNLRVLCVPCHKQTPTFGVNIWQSFKE